MDCTIYVGVKEIKFPLKRIKDIVSQVLSKERRQGSITIHIVGDKKIRTLNREHRGKDKITDVLSFPFLQGEHPKFFEQQLGDIFINPQHIKRQSKEFEVSYEEEFSRMLIHGLLHVLGYDHVQRDEAKKMFGKQERYLKALL